MNDVSANAATGEVAYSYRPSLLGAAWSFRLTPTGLAWDAGRRSGLVPYRAIRRVRLSYKPASMQSQRYLMEVWAEGAPTLKIVSSSWKGMMEQERLDKPYSAFVAALHARIAQAQVQANGDGAAAVRFEKGSVPFLYWPGLVVFVTASLGFAWLTTRALQSDSKAGAAFIGIFALLFLWQGGNFFRRNRPGVYGPRALPDELLPKG